MDRRNAVTGLMAVPLIAGLSPVLSAAAPVPTRWYIALSSEQPLGTTHTANEVTGPNSSGLIWRTERLPIAAAPVALGMYAGFTVTGHRKPEGV